MAVVITEIVGADNMRPARKDRVIELLNKLATNAGMKRFLYGRWARTVGVEVTEEDLNRVAPWRRQPV